MQEQPLISDIEKLLNKLHLKKEDLDLAEIEIEDLERATNPSFLGKCLHFSMTVSILRTLTLWPLMSRENIKLNKKKPAETKQNIANEPRNNTLSVSDFLDLDYDERTISLDSEEESNELPSKIDINNDDENNQLEITKKKKPCTASILTSSAILFESENTLRGVSAVNAFYDTTDTITSGVWNAFLSSLIINGVINYIIYENERESSDLPDAFGITGLRNIFCIRSIESIKNSTLCSENSSKGYNDILSSSLSSPYIWPFIAGIPLVFGTINAIRASRNMEAVDEQEVKKLIRELEGYNPNAFVDIFGWMITAAIPYLLPPFAILYILPQPGIKQTLEKIKQTIIWDGRLSAKDRQKLFDKLSKFAQQRSQFTQMKALSILSDIVDGINYKNLSLLQEEGVDDETIKTLITIKAKALHELSFLSTHYNLPDAPTSWYRPFFRYLYTNYLMWNLGYPQQGFLQPLFFVSKMIKLYFTLIFYKSIIGGIIEIINNYLAKKNCLEAGDEWSYFDALDEFQCTVCEDLNLFYRDIFTAHDCIRSYLDENRRTSFDEIMHNIINRDQQINKWGINRTLDLSEVTSLILVQPDIERIRFHPGELAKFLNALKLKIVKNLKRFEIIDTVNPHHPGHDGNFWNYSSTDIEAINLFIQNSSIEEFKIQSYATDYTMVSDLIISIANALPNTNIKNLSFGTTLQLFNTTMSTLAEGLRYSNVNHLELGFNTDEEGMELIAAVLADSNITWLKTGSARSSTGCYALAKKLLISRIQSLQLDNGLESVRGYSIDSSCANALIEQLILINRDFNLTLGDPSMTLYDNTISLFTKSLSIMPHLKTLRFLTESNRITQSNISALLQVLPLSKLVEFQLAFNVYFENLNFSIIIPELADALNQSMITRFDFHVFAGRLDFDALDILISYLPNKLKKITALHLCDWKSPVKSCNQNIGIERMKKLSEALPHTNIEKLELGFDNTNGKVFNILTEVLPRTLLKSLILAEMDITANEIRYFSKALKQSSIEMLEFWELNIDDEAVKALFRESLPGSPVKILSLMGMELTDNSAIEMAHALTTEKFKPRLWIEKANDAKKMSLVRALAHNSKTNLTFIDLYANPIGNEGAQAFCKILPQTNITPGNLGIKYTAVTNQSIIDNCGVLSSLDTSSTNSLHPIGPYVFLYRLYQATQQSFYAVLYNRYRKAFVDNSIQTELGYSDGNNTTAEPVSSAGFTEQTLSVIDASHYSGGETIVVDLNAHNAIAARGSVKSNNVLIGKDHSLLDVSQTRRANFLQAGKNNQLRLGFFSQDHVVVAERQGIVQIESFESKDTLHLISEHTVYSIETNTTLCQNEIINNNTPAAVIHLKETTVQLLNTCCEDIEDNIEINNPEAIYAAQVEVMDSTENQQSILYTSLLSVCDTFLNSVNKSAMFTAVPVFAAEILYRSGDYTREETEKFGEELQKLLVLSFADSPHAIAASFLASWLATKLTNSPTIISTVSIGASIVTSVAGSILNTDVTLGWIALQTGVALMGSVLGSHGVRWGLNQASSAKYYLSSRIGFWSSPCPAEDAKETRVLQLEMIPEELESRLSVN